MRIRTPFAAFSLLFVISSSPALPLFPGREVAKPKEEIVDSFLGYFVGIVDADILGRTDAEHLHGLMPEFESFYSLPFEQIREVNRSRSGGQTTVGVQFASELVLPIPFRVLWDIPGVIHATSRVTFRETRYQALQTASGRRGALSLGPLFVYDPIEGELAIDFDWWLDGLLGRAVDDIRVERVLLFREDGTWYAALMGAGYEGQLVVGYFDFRDNHVLVPVPSRFRELGLTLFGLPPQRLPPG